MKNEVPENKYKVGDKVHALDQPSKKLTIRRYVDRIYYCFDTDLPEQKEEVYFERELAPEKSGS